MPVDRKKWTESFRWERIPNWPCPLCRDGVLRPKEKNGRVEEETALSKKSQEHPGYDVDWYNAQFAALLICDTCSGVVVMSGITSNQFEPTPYDQYNIETYYRPTFFSPGPPLFRIPTACPPDVRQELGRAWNLFWVDRAACANRIRSCVEMILTGNGIKRFTVSKKGERVRLPLHDRILLYGAREPSLAEEMMAVKWLGNAGSHGSDELTADQVLDGFDLLEHVLEEVYDRRTQVLGRIKRELIRRRGRPAKKRASTAE